MNYSCPNCKSPLFAENGSLRCENGHSFDVSKEGYVNLLLSSGQKNGVHGDNKEMVKARRDFLSLGHYKEIINIISEMILKLSENGKTVTILDAGCGEGYYTEGISDKLEENSVLCGIYGIDVSKEAVKAAAKRAKSQSKAKNTFYSVASVNALPFADNSFDIVISLFAPLAEKEFSRVLKEGGVLMTVSPSENHLFGLKKLIYETPYKNPESTFEPEFFVLSERKRYEGKMFLNTSADIRNLFTMTPYYYNSKSSELEKMFSFERLETEIGFIFSEYRKI